MYDTVRLELDYLDYRGKGFLDVIPAKLENVQWHKYNNTGIEYVTGYLDNKLLVVASKKKVKIPKGNIRDWFFGNPFYELKRGTTEEAILKLEDRLSVPISESKVSRIDLGTTLSTEYKPDIYYRHFGYRKGFERQEMNNGIYYESNTDRFIVYGPLKKLQKKGIPIDDSRKQKNYLRLENRNQQRVAAKYQRKIIKAKDLYDEAFYMQVVDKWKDAYFGINKIPSKLNEIKPTGSTKEFINNLACMALSDIGQINALKLIKEWQQKRIIGKKEASDLRKKILHLSSREYCEVQSELMKELDRKVTLISDRYR